MYKVQGDEYHVWCRSLPSEKGRRPGLKVLKPTNLLYRRLLLYRYYCFRKSSGDRTSRRTGKVREFIRKLGDTLCKYDFTEDDPIQVPEFLSKFIQEAGILRMTEVQASMSLPYYLKCVAEHQFSSMRGASRASEGRVTY